MCFQCGTTKHSRSAGILGCCFGPRTQRRRVPTEHLTSPGNTHMQKLKPDHDRDSKSSQGARNMPICPASCIAAFLLEPSLKCSFGTEHRRSTTCRKSRHKMCHGACPQTTPFHGTPYARWRNSST